VQRPRRIVVVGAGPAGFAACEELRRAGFSGVLDLVGTEPHLPYARPPLSKAQLTNDDAAAGTLAGVEQLDVRWHLGSAAERLDPEAREVILANGERLRYDGLVLATGSRPRTLADLAFFDGVTVLHDLDEATRLRRTLRRPPRRLLVVGAGFIGCEVASSAAALGVAVTLVEIERLPLLRLLGPTVGEVLARAHRERGVDLRLETSVSELVGEDGALSGGILSDGSFLEADACVLALGSAPATEWLAGSGLSLDGGVLCDAKLRALGAKDVVAAGDLARWPHPLLEGEPTTVAHWSNACEQGEHAARTLLGVAAGPFVGLPSFTSNVHGIALRSLGLPGHGEQAGVLDGDPAEGSFVVGYERADRLVGALGVNANRQTLALRGAIGQPLSFAR